MPQHDFSALYAAYSDTIAKMPPIFSTHQFVQALSQSHQQLYIEALYSYRHSDTPFGIVHRVLAARLTSLDALKLLQQVSSTDIFGQPSTCAQWAKLS